VTVTGGPVALTYCNGGHALPLRHACSPLPPMHAPPCRSSPLLRPSSPFLTPCKARAHTVAPSRTVSAGPLPSPRSICCGRCSRPAPARGGASAFVGARPFDQPPIPLPCAQQTHGQMHPGSHVCAPLLRCDRWSIMPRNQCPRADEACCRGAGGGCCAQARSCGLLALLRLFPRPRIVQPLAQVVVCHLLRGLLA
jgi:hypothetical protein